VAIEEFNLSIAALQQEIDIEELQKGSFRHWQGSQKKHLYQHEIYPLYEQTV
jgi:hypothetical protein